MHWHKPDCKMTSRNHYGLHNPSFSLFTWDMFCRCVSWNFMCATASLSASEVVCKRCRHSLSMRRSASTWLTFCSWTPNEAFTEVKVFRAVFFSTSHLTYLKNYSFCDIFRNKLLAQYFYKRSRSRSRFGLKWCWSCISTFFFKDNNAHNVHDKDVHYHTRS